MDFTLNMDPGVMAVMVIATLMSFMCIIIVVLTGRD